MSSERKSQYADMTDRELHELCAKRGVLYMEYVARRRRGLTHEQALTRVTSEADIMSPYEGMTLYEIKRLCVKSDVLYIEYMMRRKAGMTHEQALRKKRVP